MLCYTILQYTATRPEATKCYQQAHAQRAPLCTCLARAVRVHAMKNTASFPKFNLYVSQNATSSNACDDPANVSRARSGSSFRFPVWYSIV